MLVVESMISMGFLFGPVTFQPQLAPLAMLATHFFQEKVKEHTGFY